MSDTILGGDFTVYYTAENRQKRVAWTGSATGTRTTNELYSALQDLFDELGQMDDGVPMSAQTSTEYTIGIIDAGDTDPWFIDRTSVEHLIATPGTAGNGAIETSSWERDLPGDGTGNTGIVRMAYTETVALVAGDIGKDVLMTIDGDRGTLLDYNDTGATKYMWIRPDDNTLANDFNNAPTGNGAWTIVGGTGTGNQAGGAAITGESLWANIYSIGTILDDDNTHIYIYQNGAYLKAYKSTTSDWWGDGHVDILVNVKEVGLETDVGYINVLARRYSQTYSYYTVDLTNGGRNPLPLQTGNDLDNQTGYSQVELGVGEAANFDVGNYFYRDNGGLTWATTNKKAVITDVDTTSDTLDYYLIGEPLADFVATDTITEYTGTGDGDGAGTVGAQNDVGPAALATPPTIFHGVSAVGDLDGNDGGSFDINEDGTFENYSIVIDCNQNLLGSTTTTTGVYEWTKYITRFGGTTTTDTDTLEGEQYIGSDMRVTYTAESAIFDEGDLVTGASSGATAIVVYHNTADNILILRRTRGTFTNGEQVDEGAKNVTGTTFSPITPISSAAFGTFAGGKFFCAPGVVLKDYDTDDANNFQLVTDNNTVIVAPTKITLLVRNTREADRVAVFRLTAAAGPIEKDNYNIDATQGAAGSNTIIVTGALDTDEPGKTAGGVIRVVDDAGLFEDRYRFTDWTSGTPSTFNLFDLSGTADADATQTLLEDDAGNFIVNGVAIGDIVYNDVEGTYAYVTAIDADTLTTTNTGSTLPVTSWSTDTYQVGNTVRAYGVADTAYVPLIDIYETTGTDVAPGEESAIVTQDGNFFVRVVARHAALPASEGIIPYTANDVPVDGVTGGGMSNTIIRTDDTIFTP